MRSLSLQKAIRSSAYVPSRWAACPRPATRRSDKVISCAGKDVTKAYTKGAETALYFAKLNHVDFAVMKAKSPSCGKGLIYDGTFTGNKIPGNGVTVELLNANGIPVFTEDELDQLPL